MAHSCAVQKSAAKRGATGKAAEEDGGVDFGDGIDLKPLAQYTSEQALRTAVRQAMVQVLNLETGSSCSSGSQVRSFPLLPW